MLPVSLQPHEQTAIAAFSDALRGRFGGRLHVMKLFGSTVRAERWAESDIDLLVLIDGVTWEEKRTVWDAATLVNIQYDTVLSPLVLAPPEFQELLNRERRIALDIEREGQAI